MRRVEARLSARRIIVLMRSTVGKAENSSGFRMKTHVIMIRIDSDRENARQMSSRKAGSGRIRTIRIAMMPTARPISLRFSRD
jgi:hypothetical protein